MASASWLRILLLLLLFPSLGIAAPKFQGVGRALAAPEAAVLFWDRATPGRKDLTVSYRVELREGERWRTLAEVRGTTYVADGLQGGRQYSFRVVAADSTGTAGATRVLNVTPERNHPAAEWRGVWITRFEWAKGSAEEITGRIRRMMLNLGRGNFNAVVFQVRGQGDTLYPSQIDPWSASIPASLRRSDPVALAIKEAKRNGLEFHAWLNLLVIWQSKEKRHPADSGHPFYQFANPKDPARRKGVVHTAPGKPLYYGEADYTWLTPGNPEVELYVRRVVLEFLQRYDVDGLHWDDRTALPHGASHDPVSLARHRGRGNPMGIRDLREWHRDQLSRILSNIYVASTARRPGLLISASPFGIYDKKRIAGYDRFKDCVHDFNTDGELWMREGSIDVLMPQIYWAEGDPEPNFGALVRDWIGNNRSGRPIWPGSALGNYGGTQPLGSVQKKYVALARAMKAGGNTFFSYSAAEDSAWAAASRTIYPRKAQVPVPIHKSAPRTGQVMGTVLDPQGRPVTDAWVRIEGRRYVYLSAADGFFAIPLVPPGTHTLTIEDGKHAPTKHRVEVRTGQTAVVGVGVK